LLEVFVNKTWQTVGLTLLLSVLGFGLLFLTGQEFNPQEFVALVRLDPVFLALLIPVLVGWWVVSGLRIKILAASKDVTLFRAVRSLLLFLYGATVTPGATGANVALAWYLSRYTDAKRATAVAVFGLTFDLVYYAWSLPLSFAILHFKGINLNLPLIGPALGIVVVIGSIVSIVFAYALAFQLQRLERLLFALFSLRWLLRFRRGALRFIQETGHAMTAIRRMPTSTQLGLHVLTALSFLLHFGAANVVAAGLGLNVDHVALLAMQSLLVAISFVVPTPGGAGYFEVVLGSSSSAVGIPSAAVAPFVIIWRFLSYFLYLFIGPFIGAPALLAASQRQQKAESNAPNAATPSGSRVNEQ
jgi:glycosyltransferase 2 family protein